MSGMIVNPYFGGTGCETQPGTDPDFASVVALLHFNGTDASTTFTDETGKTWTAAGDAQIDTAEKKLGSASGLFDGTGDYISTPDSADFAFGSGDFTIEAWVRLVAYNVGSTSAIITQRTTSTSDHSFSFQCASSSVAGAIEFQWTTDGTTLNEVETSGGFVPLDEFTHVAVCRSGTDLNIFVNGTLVETGAISGTLHDSGQEVKIGANNATPISFLNGWIDELRVTKGVARYTSSFLIQCNEFADS